MSKSSKTKSRGTSEQQTDPFGPARGNIEAGLGQIGGFLDFQSQLPLQAGQSADTLAAQQSVRDIATQPSEFLGAAQGRGRELLDFQDINQQRLGGLGGLGGAIGLGGLADQARDPFSSQAFAGGINQLGTDVLQFLDRANTQTAGDLSSVGRFRGRGGGVDDLTFGRNTEQAFDAFSRGAAGLGIDALGRQAQAQQQLFQQGLGGLQGAGGLGVQGAQVQQGALNAAPNTFNLGLIQPGLQGQLGGIEDARQRELLGLQQQQELQPLNLAGSILNQSAGVGSAFGQQTGSFQNRSSATPSFLDQLGQVANIGATIAGAFPGSSGPGPGATAGAAPQVSNPIQFGVQPQFTQQFSPFDVFGPR